MDSFCATSRIFATFSILSFLALFLCLLTKSIGMLEDFTPTKSIFYFRNPWACKTVAHKSKAENCIWIIKRQSSPRTRFASIAGDLHSLMELKLNWTDCPLNFLVFSTKLSSNILNSLFFVSFDNSTWKHLSARTNTQFSLHFLMINCLSCLEEFFIVIFPGIQSKPLLAGSDSNFSHRKS